MIVDSSAVVAIVKNEDNAQMLLEAVVATTNARMSAASLLETYMVIDGSQDTATIRRAEELLDRLRLEIVPVTEAQIHIARDAFRSYGKGSGHGARLNYGDCFAYALAKATGEPLLFVGDDFARTDIPSAV